MSVLIQMCFIHVVGGYVNVAQIARITESSINNDCRSLSKKVCIYTTNGVLEAGDKTPEDFLARIRSTCGGKDDTNK